MEQDIAFEMAASSIRFGWGVTREVGMDLVDCGAKRVMVVTDPVLRELPPVATVLTALEEAGVPHVLFDRVQIEPTDSSFKEAIAFAVGEQVDAFVAVGGGSTIDTAKAANLYATYPADFLDYVNAPIGKGLPVPGPLKPLIAIPTTAGTGSETTGTAIFDLVSMHAKDGHLPPQPQAHAWHYRPRKHGHLVANGSSIYRLRRAESCPGVLYGNSVYHAALSETPYLTAGVSRSESRERPMGAGDARHGGAVSPAGYG